MQFLKKPSEEVCLQLSLSSEVLKKNLSVSFAIFGGTDTNIMHFAD